MDDEYSPIVSRYRRPISSTDPSGTADNTIQDKTRQDKTLEEERPPAGSHVRGTGNYFADPFYGSRWRPVVPTGKEQLSALVSEEFDEGGFRPATAGRSLFWNWIKNQ